MSKEASVSERIQLTITTYRWGFAITGLVAVVLGIFVLVWPHEVIWIAALLVGIYAVASGLFYVVASVRATATKFIIRVARTVAGIAFITAGIVMLSFLGTSAAVLANVLSIVLGALWIAEGVSSFILLKGRLEQRPVATAYAVIAIAIGVVLLLTPLWGAGALRWFVGIALVVLGGAQVYRAAMASRAMKVELEVKDD